VTCRELADFMADYVSGELPAGVREAFDGHLALCPNCRTYLANYEDTIKLGKAAFADGDAAVPASVPEQLVKAILDARGSNRGAR
jgi:anti-sigma factor RsiW